MASLAIEAYEKCPIGGTGSIRPSSTTDHASELSRFQQDVEIALQLERDGKIQIVIDHKESQTGFDFVDLILFKRLE